jgi:hypothetical protein
MLFSECVTPGIIAIFRWCRWLEQSKRELDGGSESFIGVAGPIILERCPAVGSERGDRERE